MHYCPHCSEPLYKKVDVCPECKNVIDYKLLGNLIEESETSHLNRKAKRRIWFKEHALMIIPIITLIIGFVIGGILMFGYLQIAFHNERDEYDAEIAKLNNTIAQNQSAAQSSSQQFEGVIAEKDQIIQILGEQLDLMGRAVNFTTRLDRNSTITPTSAQESDFYRRNILYLRNQFEQQVEAMTETSYEPRRAYSLITIPSLIDQAQPN
jgi:hypothetical protein